MASNGLLAARAKAQIFQEELERRVKRLEPVQLAEAFSIRIEQVLEQRDLMSKWPVHYMVHAIEACCAYARKSYSRPPNNEDLRKIVNVYHEYFDPVSHYLLTDSNRIDVFFAMYARQQFYLQEETNRHDAARGIILFDESHYPVTSQRLREQFGFTFHNWITFCFIIHAGILGRSPAIIDTDYFHATKGIAIARDRLPRLFAALSATVDQVRNSYWLTREKFGYLYDPYYPSFFAKKPLLEIGAGVYLAPHKGLVIRQAAEGLFDLGKDNWPKQFGAEFGDAFEQYVGNVLRELPNVSVLTEQDMRKVTDDKMCDYLVVGDEYVFLVECKAVEYSAAMSSEGAIKGDNSTTKIAKAVDQVLSAANLLANNERAKALGGAQSRSILAAIVTFRHIYMANTTQYWESSILPHVKNPQARNWQERFAFRPQVLDVAELEQVVLLVKHKGETPLALFGEKLSQSEFLVGEWSTFLGERTVGLSLRVLENVFERFTSDLLSTLEGNSDQGSEEEA